MHFEPKGYEPEELLVRIFLNYPKDHIRIENKKSFIEFLKSISSKTEFCLAFGKVKFITDRGQMNCPVLEQSFEDMKDVMLIPDENDPSKYYFDKEIMKDFADSFPVPSVDPRVIKKVAEYIDKKISIKSDYAAIKAQNSHIIQQRQTKDNATGQEGPPLEPEVNFEKQVEAKKVELEEDIQSVEEFGG